MNTSYKPMRKDFVPILFLRKPKDAKMNESIPNPDWKTPEDGQVVGKTANFITGEVTIEVFDAKSNSVCSVPSDLYRSRSEDLGDVNSK